jgi:hypothetical protein
MARDRKDRSVSWFMAHHGGSLLRLAPVGPVVAWHAAQTVLSFPKQIPDGLLDVTFASHAAPDPFLVEIESYPEQDTPEQIRKDVAMVLLTRGVLPDVVLVALRPKGNLALSRDQFLRSAHGLAELRLTVHLVNLWTVSAEELLATGDVGLIPWVPLADYSGPPEALLQECRQRIEQQGRPEERDNLLAITRVMAETRYNDARLLSVLGGPIMSFEKVLLETPAGQRFIEQKAAEGRQMAEAAARETARNAVLRTLRRRFRAVPEDLAGQLATIQEQQRLDDLLDVAIDCPNVDAFRRALSAP